MSATMSHSPRSTTESSSLRDLLAQVRLVVLHPAQREAGADHAPPPDVLGRVHVDHRRHRALGPRALARAERPPLPAQPPDVVVGRGAPDADRVVPVHRRLGPHPRRQLLEPRAVEVGRQELDLGPGRVVGVRVPARSNVTTNRSGSSARRSDIRSTYCHADDHLDGERRRPAGRDARTGDRRRHGDRARLRPPARRRRGDGHDLRAAARRARRRRRRRSAARPAPSPPT